MNDQKEFNTHLNLCREDVFNATEDEAAYDMTDDDMIAPVLQGRAINRRGHVVVGSDP